MEDFIDLIPEETKFISPLEEDKDEQRTPKRTTIEYETTGKFKDISKKIQDTT